MKKNWIMVPVVIIITIVSTTWNGYSQMGEQDALEKKCKQLIIEQKFDELIATSKTYVNRHPTSAMAYSFLVTGYHYKKIGLFQFRNELKDFFAQNQTLPYAHYSLGIYYMFKEQYDYAEKELRKAVQLNPNDGYFHYSLGGLLTEKGKIEEGMRHTKKALKLLPGFALAQENFEAGKGAIRNPEKFSIRKLGADLISALKKRDNSEINQLIRENKELIRDSPSLTVQHCRALLHESIKLKSSGVFQTANYYFTAASIIAEAYYHVTGREYPKNKVDVFGNLSKKGEKIYLKAHSIFQQAENLRTEFKNKEALEAFEKCLRLYREIDFKEGIAKTIQGKGDVYSALLELPRAREQYKSALGIVKKSKDLLSETDCLLRLGKVCYMLSKNTDALDNYKSAHNLSQIINSPSAKANALAGKAEVYAVQSKNSEAREHYESAIKIFRQINERHDEAYALSGLGDIFLATSEYMKARVKYKLALKIFKEVKDPLGEANTLASLGEVHRLLAENTQALNLFDSALKKYNKIKYRLGEATVLNNMGNVYKYLSDYRKAGEYFKKALQLFLEIEIMVGIGNTLQSIGQFFYELSDYEGARLSFEYALKSFRETKNRMGEGNALCGLGDVCRASKDFNNAETYYRKAIKVQLDAGDRSGLLWSYFGLGKLYKANQNETQAKNEFKNSIEILEDVWSQMKETEMKTGYLSSRLKPYRALISLLCKTGRSADAFNYAQRSKARNFLYMLGKERINMKNVPLNTIAQEKEKRSQIITLSAKLKTANPTIKKSLKKDLKKLKKEHRKIVKKIRSYSLESASMNFVAPLTLKEIQAVLSETPDTILLDYYTTSDEVHLWVVDNKSIHHQKLEIHPKQLAEKIEEYRIHLKNSDLPLQALSRLSSTLYNVLIEPVAAHLDNKNYFGIIPHGPLHYIPFETLMKEEKFLGELNFKMFYLPSASTFKYCWEKNRQQKNSLFAVGNPDGSLPNSEREIKILKKNNPNGPKPFFGKDATEYIAKQYGGTSDFVHFSCHGTFDSTKPMKSALLLNPDSHDDGRLEVHEIFQMQLKPAYLVTLSACNTNLGRIRPGDEIIGLTRAFIYAGTPSILASLWKVRDDYTSVLMTKFYDALKDTNKIEALHTARQEIIYDYGLRHPYYWAAFVLIGDYR